VFLHFHVDRDFFFFKLSMCGWDFFLTQEEKLPLLKYPCPCGQGLSQVTF